MKTKQIYMLTNGYAEMPQGFYSILYAGLGYELAEEDANALIESGCALVMEDASVKSKAKNRSSRGPSDSDRGKRLSKGRRNSRGHKNSGDDQGGD